MKLKFLLIVLLAGVAFLLGTKLNNKPAEATIGATCSLQGAFQCNGNVLEVCGSDLTWEYGQDCSLLGYVCRFGNCVDPNSCPTVGENRCGSNNTLQFCNSNHIWETFSTCAQNQVCQIVGNTIGCYNVSSPTNTPAPPATCQHNVWGGCSGTTERCVTQEFALCAGGGCSCYSNDCDDGSTRQCGAIATNTPNPVPTGNPPKCSGGITIAGLTPNGQGIYTVSQGQTITLRANNVTDPDGNSTLAEMRFAYKPTSVNTCPPNPQLLLLDPKDTDPSNGFTLTWNTTGVAPGTYDVWGTPRDLDFNGCSGNPSANAGNNYCTIGTGCTNCKTVINIQAVTPTIDPCPGGAKGNLDCNPNGCVNSYDFNLFEINFGKPISQVSIQQGHRSPNLYSDQSPVIDTADYEILRQNYNPNCTP